MRIPTFQASPAPGRPKAVEAHSGGWSPYTANGGLS